MFPSAIPHSVSSPPIAASSITMVPSPALTSRSMYNDSLPFTRSPSADFEIEHVPSYSPGKSGRPAMRRGMSDYTSEDVLQASVAKVIAAKARPFSVSGRIPVDPANLTLFFRTKSGITHSLDFPIDVDYDTPPALDVLIAACRPHESTDDDYYAEGGDSLYYPSNLPLTTSLEIANHPILEAVRNTLFPTLPGGHYLTALRDKLEVITAGSSMAPQPKPTDGRVATVVVALPVRFRGGALVVRNMEGEEERFQGRGGKTGHMEWAAMLADCDYEVEPVQKGCRLTISYAVHLKTFGPSGVQPDPLIAPSDYFLDQLAPILNLSRSRMVAFYLTGDYGVNPADVLAETLVPYLKGGDSLLYHALKLYKLSPELRWTAGGYIWPVDRTVECGPEPVDGSPYGGRRPLNGTRRQPPVRGQFSAYVEEGDEEEGFLDLRSRVEDSGAMSLDEADIIVLNDNLTSGPISKERVPLVTGGVLDKLVVNILLVVYVP